eukprot:UN3197
MVLLPSDPHPPVLRRERACGPLGCALGAEAWRVQLVGAVERPGSLASAIHSCHQGGGLGGGRCFCPLGICAGAVRSSDGVCVVNARVTAAR